MYDYDYYNSLGTVGSNNSALGYGIWAVIAFVLAIVGGILVYCLFLNAKNEKKVTKFWKWLYDFLSFKKMFVEALLKVTYLCATIFITLYSFAFIGSSFLAFVGLLILGNLVLRVVYEYSLILIMLWKNTKEINEKTK